MTPASRRIRSTPFTAARFWLVQPKRGGHRAGIDAMILAACVPSDFAGRLADFGAGAGAAGLAVAVALPGRRRSRSSNSRRRWRDFARPDARIPAKRQRQRPVSPAGSRCRAGGEARETAGLGRNSFDFVIMNPPFNAGATAPRPTR